MGNILERGLALLSSILIARHYSPADVGLIAPALVLSTIASRICEFGIPATIQREAAKELGAARQLLASGLSLRIWVNVLMVAGLAAYGRVVGGSWHVALVTVLAGLASALTGLTQLATAVFAGRLATQYVAVIQVTYRVLYLGVVFLLTRFDASILSLMAVLVLPAAVQLVLGIGLLRRTMFRPRMRWSRHAWRRLIAESWALGVGGIMVATYDRIDTLISSWYVPASAVGSYYSAYSIYTSTLLVANAFNSVAYSAIAGSVHSAPDSVRMFYQRALLFIMGVGAACGLVMFVARRWIVEMLFGARYAGAAVFLAPLSLAVMFVFGNNLGGVTLNAIGRQKVTLATTVAGVALNVVLNLIYIPRLGAPAAAMTTLATEAVVCAATFVALRVLLRPAVGAAAPRPERA